MKGLKFTKTLMLFDYFKRTFELNKKNKQLYTPQVLFLILKGGLLLLTFFSFLQVFDRISPLIGNDFSKVMTLLWSTFRGVPLIMTLTTLIVLLFGSTFVEAGLYHMYALLVQGKEDHPSFMLGASKYFFPFLGGNILIFLFWVIALLPYLLVGLLTLSIGLFLIPIMVGILLITWKASLVVDDDGLFTALKNSINFGKKNFIPLGVFVVIKNALSSLNGGSGGGSSNFSNSYNNYNSFNELPNGPNLGGWNNSIDPFLDGMRIVMIVLFSIISVTTILAGLIQMLFDIFFGLCSVVIYVDKFYIPDPDPIPEALDINEIIEEEVAIDEL